VIITRTPFRISFFGGGADYPAYYREHGGAVLNTTINKYCHIICRRLPPFFGYRFLIRYSKNEVLNEIEQIQHPSVRECLKFAGVQESIEVVHTGDLPAMSGIGSSSAFTVGLLQALYALQGKIVTKRKLAFDAIHVEQDLIGENVGSQDQVAAAFGGFNKTEFGGSEDIFVQPVTVGQEKLRALQEHLLFCFTGLSRIASETAADQIRNIPRNLTQLRAMRGMVDEAIAILNADEGSLHDFGKLLHEAWRLKRELSSQISNSRIDQLYETARRAGALGGKICGAGGGGFMVLFVPKHSRDKVREALKGLLFVPFRFENIGAHILAYSA